MTYKNAIRAFTENILPGALDRHGFDRDKLAGEWDTWVRLKRANGDITQRQLDSWTNPYKTTTYKRTP